MAILTEPAPINSRKRDILKSDALANKIDAARDMLGIPRIGAEDNCKNRIANGGNEIEVIKKDIARNESHIRSKDELIKRLKTEGDHISAKSEMAEQVRLREENKDYERKIEAIEQDIANAKEELKIVQKKLKENPPPPDLQWPPKLYKPIRA